MLRKLYKFTVTNKDGAIFSDFRWCCVARCAPSAISATRKDQIKNGVFLLFGITASPLCTRCLRFAEMCGLHYVTVAWNKLRRPSEVK